MRGAGAPPRLCHPAHRRRRWAPRRSAARRWLSRRVGRVSWIWTCTASPAPGGTALSDMSAEPTALELDDKFHDECGLFGVWNHAEAANVAYLGLYALQHRGQESAGIASTDGHHFQV